MAQSFPGDRWRYWPRVTCAGLRRRVGAVLGSLSVLSPSVEFTLCGPHFTEVALGAQEVSCPGSTT